MTQDRIVGITARLWRTRGQADANRDGVGDVCEDLPPSVPPSSVPGVIGLTVIPDSEILQVSWTNPDIDSITGFDITWQRTHGTDGDAVTETAVSGMKDDETEAGANASYLISDVLDNHVYTVSVTVFAANGGSATARAARSCTGSQ